MSKECVGWGQSWNNSIFKESSCDTREWVLLKDELGETEEKRKECLEKLIKKLTEEKDLIPCLDEEFLLAFLRVAKFNTSKAYNRILKYYRQLRNFEYQYQDIPASVIPKTEWFHYFFASPHRMADNSIVLVQRHGLFEPDEMTFDEFFFLDILVCSQFMMHAPFQISGVTCVADISDFTFKKFLLHTPRRMANYVNVFQNTYPFRYRKIHIINMNSLFGLLLRMVMPLLSKKLRERIVVHPYDEKYESLHSAVPPELLPEWYGGHIKASDMIDLTSNAKEMNEEFQKQFKFGYVRKND